MRVLLIEDDPRIGAAARAGLEQAGFGVEWLRQGRGVVELLRHSSFDAVVLDLGLPDVEGIELLGRIRAAGLDLPVLILSVRSRVADRVDCLDRGADDYVVKPFEMEELVARLRALVRRYGGRATPVIEHGPLRLDPLARRVTCDGEPVALSAREFAVLQLLLEYEGRVLTREQIEEQLYGWNETVESNAVEVHIYHLRKKLWRSLITTVRGVGYMVPNWQARPPRSASR